jgi:digeranylgeranylglycerophospholipid reductase
VCQNNYNFKLRRHKVYVIDRNRFEIALIDEAKNKGIELKLGIRMKDFIPPHKIVLEDGSIVEGKIIIDATGIACKVGTKLGLPTKLIKQDVGVCIQSTVKANFEKNLINFWFHKPYAPFGYAWIFPKNSEIANIGLGIPGGMGFDISKLLNSYIEKVIDGKYEIINTFRDCVPIGPPLEDLVKDNVMIVGDAARLVHAPSGAGIGNALFSGSLAGLIAAKKINGEIESLEIYKTSLERKLKLLRRAYKNKTGALKSDEVYFKRYNKAIHLLQIIHNLIPNASEKQLGKRIDKDRIELESLGDIPFFS